MRYNKNKVHKTLDYWSWDMHNLDFLEKSLGIVSPPQLVNDFSRKTFLVEYFINWPDFIVWFMFEILRNICIVIVVNKIVT